VPPARRLSRIPASRRTEEVPLPDTGTVITFTIVYLPIPTSALEPPFVVANLVLDGSDQTFIHLVSGCKKRGRADRHARQGRLEGQERSGIIRWTTSPISRRPANRMWISWP